MYSLPKAFLGIEIKSPGLGEISLYPSLLGLKKAIVDIPTPSGNIVCELEIGKEPVIKVPDNCRTKITLKY